MVRFAVVGAAVVCRVVEVANVGGVAVVRAIVVFGLVVGADVFSIDENDNYTHSKMSIYL